MSELQSIPGGILGLTLLAGGTFLAAIGASAFALLGDRGVSIGLFVVGMAIMAGGVCALRGATDVSSPVGKARDGERILYYSGPAMFRNRPLTFTLLAVSVIGWPILAIWWVRCLGTTLEVTDRRSVLRRGLLSKATTEVLHGHIRNLQISQSMLQRIFDVGTIGISSAGQSGMEIVVGGLPHPAKLKQCIDRNRPEVRGV